MKLTIDNLDGAGARDYTALVEAGKLAPSIHRRLNKPGAMMASIVPGTSGLPVPVNAARIVLSRADASVVFTGRITAVNPEYAGRGERGVICRYQLLVESDEAALDQKALPVRSAFVDRTAGDILR